MSRKPKVRPVPTWRYGHKDNPLFILEKNGNETDVRFVKEVTHNQFRVSIAGYWHTFTRNSLYAYKTQVFDEPWISSVAYWSLMAMAEHVMCAVFHSFQRHAKPSRRVLFVEEHRVQLIKLSRGYLVFKWSDYEYTVTEDGLGPTFDPSDGAPKLPIELRCFFELFVKWIWPALPLYKTKAQVERSRIERRIARAPGLSLLPGDLAPALAPPKKKKKARPVVSRTSNQLSLFNR